MPSHSFQQPDNGLVIGITGRIGAGKTSVGKYLESAHGFYYIRYSQVLSEWRAANPESKAHLQVVGWDVMAGGMQQELNDRVIANIASQGNCAVDGLRHPVDFESLSTAFPPEFHLLFIESTPETRWKRLAERYPDFEVFLHADSHPVEQYIDSLRDRAAAVIENDGPREELFMQVDEFLNKTRPGGQL